MDAGVAGYCGVSCEEVWEVKNLSLVGISEAAGVVPRARTEPRPFGRAKPD